MEYLREKDFILDLSIIQHLEVLLHPNKSQTNSRCPHPKRLVSVQRDTAVFEQALEEAINKSNKLKLTSLSFLEEIFIQNISKLKSGTGHMIILTFYRRKFGIKC